MRILFVDDDYDDYFIFCEALHETNADAHCQYSAHGAAALTFLEEQFDSPPDYIFLDLQMPVMGGIECLKKIKADERLKHIPVILFSSSVDPRKKDNYKHLGAEDYIVKPASFRDIVEFLKSIAEAR